MPAKTGFQSKQSEARILQRRAKVVELTLQGWTQYKIGKELGVSNVTVHCDLKEMVKEWKETYIEDIDKIKAKEVARIEHILAAHWEEFEVSKWREVPEKRDKTGKIISKATKKRVVADLEILKSIRECVLQLWKLYGIAQDINLSATQNNVNVGGANNTAPLGSPGSISAENFPWQLLFGKPVETSVDPIEAEIQAVLGESPSGATVQLPDYPNKVPLEEVERNGDGRSEE